MLSAVALSTMKILSEEQSRCVIMIIYSEKALIDKYKPGYDMQNCWWDDSASNDILFKFTFLAEV